MTKGIVFDKETTGLIINRKRKLDLQPWTVEDFALKIDMDTGEELGTYHSHYKPGTRMEKQAEKVTGLTDEFLSTKPMFSEKIDEVESFFEDCEFLIGQNIMFDINVMMIDFERCNRTFFYEDKTIIDLVEATEYIQGFRMKLGDLYEYLFNERFAAAHTGEADVRATAKIYLELKKRGDI